MVDVQRGQRSLNHLQEIRRKDRIQMNNCIVITKIKYGDGLERLSHVHVRT